MSGNSWSTPESAVRNGWRWYWVVGPSLLVAVGIVILIGYLAAGWFGQANANRGYAQTVHGSGYQTATTHDMETDLANISGTAVDRSAVPANSPEQITMRASQLNQLQAFCASALQLTTTNPADAALPAKAAANCDAGVPIADPPLANPVPAGS